MMANAQMIRGRLQPSLMLLLAETGNAIWTGSEMIVWGGHGGAAI